MSNLIQTLVELALEEWAWFGKQEYDIDGDRIRKGKQETDDDASERIRHF